MTTNHPLSNKDNYDIYYQINAHHPHHIHQSPTNHLVLLDYQSVGHYRRGNRRRLPQRPTQLGLTNTTYAMSGILLVVLVAQFRMRTYTAWIYWLAVVLLSVVGTLITDNLVDNLGVSLVTATSVFSVALIAVFGLWYQSERTLSIHSITTVRREVFYWLAILFTFALGTAAGDLLAETLNLGYLLSAVLFAGVIALVALVHYRLKLDAITAFWVAYIITRPLGASIGDYLSQLPENGGLGLGTTVTSVIFLTIILGFVIYLAITKKDHIAPSTLV